METQTIPTLQEMLQTIADLPLSANPIRVANINVQIDTYNENVGTNLSKIESSIAMYIPTKNKAMSDIMSYQQTLMNQNQQDPAIALNTPAEDQPVPETDPAHQTAMENLEPSDEDIYTASEPGTMVTLEDGNQYVVIQRTVMETINASSVTVTIQNMEDPSEIYPLDIDTFLDEVVDIGGNVMDQQEQAPSPVDIHPEDAQVNIIGYKGKLFVNGFVGGQPIPDDATDVTLQNLTPALENDPTQPEQLGFICDATKLSMNAEAKELLKTIRPSADAIGDVDMFMSGDQAIFGWLGGPLTVFDPTTAEGSRQYDTSVLDHIPVVEVEIPQDIKDYFKTEEA